MRVCENRNDLIKKGQTLAWFVDDVIGGCLIECGNCGHNYVQPFNPKGYDTAEYCPECKSEVLYPGWSSW